MLLEFLLPRRPISHQSKDAAKRQRWKDFVAAEARKAWGNEPAIAVACQLTLVYFCAELPADIDNIIKPIQDALVGIVYVDDSYVTDVDSHRRPLAGTFNIARLPSLVLPAFAAAQECVYVRISNAQPIENYL
jgi:crossover junction endodeoxyribonuclease RusA